ncbi:MAG: SDR family NAD(P)-dependent oxidoreductase [Ottowia sp.]|uniref:SDR family NAD(P)-dependent oxidoreductase n=1 Tax=Ottowia sp. TaxID=1898956 RepID=UPI003C738E69
MNPSRVAIITGGAGSIGSATARKLSAAGHHIVILDRASEAIAKVVGDVVQAGGSAEGHVLDVTDENAATELFAAIDRKHGRIDILVNNAGAHAKNPDGTPIMTGDLSTAAWAHDIAVNLTGPFVLCRLALPSMQRNQWGRIVNISSRGGRAYIYQTASYGASKAGLIGLTRVLAGEYGKFGITANVVAPGRIKTPGTDAAPSTSNLSHRKYLENTPVARIGTPDEIADAVAYLASEGAGFVTGAIIDVNGGNHMA